MALLLDTTVVIDLLRGEEANAALLEPGREPLMISAVTVHEVLAGVRAGDEEMTETMLSSFVAVPFSSIEADLTGNWWRSYRAQGITLDFRDLAIAATAVIRNLPLATSNLEDFPMPELRVEQWPPPPV